MHRRFRLVAHVLPTVVVLAGFGLVVGLMALVFSAVFLVDDAAEVNARDALSTGLFLVGLVLGVTLASLAVGVALDRVTTWAPWFVRVPAVLVVPALGAALLAVGVDAGFYVLELGVVLCGYWAVFLLQEPVLRVLRRVLHRLRGTTSASVATAAPPHGSRRR